MKGLSLQVMILTVAMLAGSAQLTAQCFGPLSVAVQGSGSGLPLSASETHINAQCPGENGLVTITATGGTQPYVMGVGTFSQPVGTQSYTVIDFVGCMTSVSVTITVNLRFIGCPANLSKNVDPGVCNTSVTLALPTTSGVCGSSALEFRYRTVDAANNPTGPYNAYAPSGNNTVLFDRGKYEVEWRLSDGSGSSVCSFYVTIVDHQAPAIICPVNQSITANASCSGKIGDWMAASAVRDNCSPSGSIGITQSPASSTVLNGYNASTLVTMTANDGNGNTSTCTFTVTLKDVSPPTVLCKPFTANLNAAGLASIVPANVYQSGADNCGAVNLLAVAPSTFNCSNIGENLVTLRVNDGNGNSASCVALVTVRDANPPVAICKSITANLGSNGTVIVPASSINNGSSDNCSFTLLLTPNTFNCSQIGINTVALRVTDASGNTATCSAKVTVRDVSAPIAKCKNPTIFLNDAGQATLSVAQVDNGSTDNCGIGSKSLSKTSFNCSEISGTNPVTLTLTDVNGNSSSCLSYVTVKDAIVPTAVCKNITVQLNAYGKVTVYAKDLAVNSYDNCSVWSYSPLAKLYTKANLGKNNLTITVKDWSNNASTCVSVVTVRPFTGLNGDDGDRSDSESGDLEIRLFPNPTAGDANLAFALPAEQAFTLILYDMSGRMVLHHKGIGLEGYNTFPIHLEGFAAGIYIVDFQTEGLKGKKRLVVQR